MEKIYFMGIIGVFDYFQWKISFLHMIIKQILNFEYAI